MIKEMYEFNKFQMDWGGGGGESNQKSLRGRGIDSFWNNTDVYIDLSMLHVILLIICSSNGHTVLFSNGHCLISNREGQGTSL